MLQTQIFCFALVVVAGQLWYLKLNKLKTKKGVEGSLQIKILEPSLFERLGCKAQAVS